MNIVQILIICVAFLISVRGFCVPQERNHVLLHDGDQLNDEIYNFSIQTRKNENCDQILWIKFFIKWKWRNSEENFDLLSQEILRFQAAFSSYFNALFQKFKSNPIELILESVDVNMFNNVEKPDDFTEIRTLLRCKSTLKIVSKFLEQDCDNTIRILLENFRIKQFFLYFQEESVSSEVYYDYFESEAARDVNLSHDKKLTYEISINVKYNKQDGFLTTQIPQAQEVRMLQDQFEEIYDDVKNDDTTDHIKRDFYIKDVVPLKNDKLSFYIVAEILFPWIDPKNLSDRDSKNYQKLLKDFAEYVEKSYIANPIIPNTRIKCKVDEIIDSFEKVGQHFIAIPNALIVNFHLQPIGFEIDTENVKLLDGNVFDKIFENFKSEELFKAYERDADDEYFVDRDGLIFDNFIAPNKEELRGSWNGVYKEFEDVQNDNFGDQSSSSSQILIEISLDKSNNLMHPISTINVNNADKDSEFQNIQMTQIANDNIETPQNSNKPIFVIEGVEMKIKKNSDLFACKNCKIFIYQNFEMKIIELNNATYSEEEEDVDVMDYSEYDYSSLEKLDDFIDLKDESDESLESEDVIDQIEFSGATENIKENDESMEELDKTETENVHRKFDPNDPMWKNIIDTSQSSENDEDYIASKFNNELSVENYSEEDSSKHDKFKVLVTTFSHQSPSSDESSSIENFELYQHDAGANETLPPSENYVMINKSVRMKSRKILVIFLVIYVINNVNLRL